MKPSLKINNVAPYKECKFNFDTSFWFKDSVESILMTPVKKQKEFLKENHPMRGKKKKQRL